MTRPFQHEVGLQNAPGECETEQPKVCLVSQTGVGGAVVKPSTACRPSEQPSSAGWRWPSSQPREEVVASDRVVMVISGCEPHALPQQQAGNGREPLRSPGKT